MDNTYKTIVLVTDGSIDSRPAEQTAMQLAQDHKAKLFIVDTVRRPSLASQLLNTDVDGMFDLVTNGKQNRLNELAQTAHAAGLDVETRLLIGKSSMKIAQLAVGVNADLVIRYRKGPKSAQLSPFGNTARNLMRVCPCPLLLVGDTPIEKPHVLACVNAEHDSAENDAILSAAERLAGDNLNLEAVYCWNLYGTENLAHYLDDQAYQGFLKEAESNCRSIFDHFLHRHKLESFNQRIHLKHGDPIQIIPEFCRDEKIDVAIMCSASLNHPLRRLLGSTIESLLDRVPCSLLVVKPKGFQSQHKTNAVEAEVAGASNEQSANES